MIRKNYQQLMIDLKKKLLDKMKQLIQFAGLLKEIELDSLQINAYAHIL